MYYEVYLDSLFLINFVMDLYLLILVDRSTLRTATRKRLILGAAVGACWYLLPFCQSGRAWLKWLISLAGGTGMMIWIAFRPGSVRAVRKILEKLLLYSFLMGGLLLFLNGCFPFLRERMMSVCGILGFGALGFLFATYVREVRAYGKTDNTCKATLIRGERRTTVTALIDSGNSLSEPVSGKPVSVIGADSYRILWGEEQTLFRAVPYRSVGKRRGILRGVVLPELRLEIDGMVKSFRDVYVAVGEEQTEGIGLILNPALLEEKNI